MQDLISRQDVISAVLASNFSACTVYGRSEEGMATAKELIQTIKNLPSAQPERKKGKWVYHDDDDMRYDTYHCSSCRKLFTVDAERFDDIGFVKEDLKYCPNCGSYNGGGDE